MNLWREKSPPVTQFTEIPKRSIKNALGKKKHYHIPRRLQQLSVDRGVLVEDKRFQKYVSISSTYPK